MKNYLENQKVSISYLHAWILNLNLAGLKIELEQKLGRKVPLELAIENPTLEELYEAVKSLKLTGHYFHLTA